LRFVFAVVAVLVVNLILVMSFGYLLATHAATDELAPADAVVVLGGQHDGREDLGVAVAHQVGAHTVVLSNPYRPSDRVMKRLCGSRSEGVEVICLAPVPDDTRGEAMFTHKLASDRGWKRIVVISWRYHLPRARLIFRQCFDSDPASVIMVPAPRDYTLSPMRLGYIAEYQYWATIKALLRGTCDGI
jgi:uncharacterized SAM-binding protein YcdF (DUF218 family)